MKQVYITTIIIIILTMLVLFLLKILYYGKPLNISYIGSYKTNEEHLSNSKSLNSLNWVIVTNKTQKQNFELEGYILPEIDFNKNFIIISKFKIKKLYKKSKKNNCTGGYDGIAIFNIKESNEELYYIYLMPPLLLSQGIG